MNNAAPQATANASAGGGIGLFGLTFLVLLVGKLGFDWAISWFIVFLPLIISFSIVVLLIVFVIVLAILD